ncbi:MAG: TlpA family protein disulfide reductase [Candidatus Solibacter usitatus]|nr:TlpA family protein disulfide reductase [Candidatus Solibacter usitatus]
MRALTRRAVVGAFVAAASLGAATLPRPAGEVSVVSHTGQVVKLSMMKGKVVVLEFLLTHCPSCKHSARLLAKMQSEYGSRGLQVIGLAIDEGAGPKLEAFVRETGANFPVGVYGNAAAYDYLQHPMITNMLMPQLAIVDRKGMIREQHGGNDPWMAEAMEERNLRAALEKLLKEPAGAAMKKAAGKK